MDIGSKLQIRPGARVSMLGQPAPHIELPAQATIAEDPADADAVIVFVTRASEIDSTAVPVIRAAVEDRLAWIAYPKAGQLGTALNRDTLAVALTERGARPVRQISIDDVWSALRFRPT